MKYACEVNGYCERGLDHDGACGPMVVSDIEKAVDATLDLASENQRLRERSAELERERNLWRAMRDAEATAVLSCQREIERMRERVAELERALERVALCLSTPNTAIADTIWLDESARSTPTLFEFICCALGRDIAPPSQPRRDIEAELDAALAQVTVLREALEAADNALHVTIAPLPEDRETMRAAQKTVRTALASTPAPDILRRVAERAADAALRACDELVRSDPDYVAMDPLPVFSSLDRTAIIEEATRG